MEIIPILCPQCGANVDLNNIRGNIGKCPYCETEYVIKDNQTAVDISKDPAVLEELRAAFSREKTETERLSEELADIANKYSYKDVEKAFGFTCQIPAQYEFSKFTAIYGHQVEYAIKTIGGGMGVAVIEKPGIDSPVECQSEIDKDNIEELLSPYKKKAKKKGLFGSLFG